MSFYGNITNVTKTGFSFDRIYPNRVQMEENMETDGIYIGRFVLIDYDKDSENVREVFYPLDKIELITGTTYLYAEPDCINKLLFNSTGDVINENNLITGVNLNDVCYVNLTDGLKKFFICTGEEKKTGIAQFEEFSVGEQDDESLYRWHYAYNYNEDQKKYGDINNTSIGRGWDSTVWQKVYENGQEKYVMVAELNSVVPTFAMSADSPTLTPITPHFDEVSNNTYYEIHWQPQWGMRIKHAEGLMSADGTSLVDDDKKVLSDETTTWIQPVYNKQLKLHQYYYYGTDKTWHLVKMNNKKDEVVSFNDIVKFVNEQKDSQLPAAIYYNRAGFNAGTHFRSSLEDKLTMAPTGFSQTPATYKKESDKNTGAEISVADKWEYTQYNNHATGGKEKKVDTQEWQMILPSLGNAISSMWDIVYGSGVDENNKPVYTYKNGEIVLDDANRPIGALDSEYKRLTYIDWADGELGDDSPRLRMVHQDNNGFTYSVNDVETLAGCINSVHDLMGMIIADQSKRMPDDEFAQRTDEDKIYYFKDGGYYRRGIGYKYEPIEDYIYEKIDVNVNNYKKDLYFYLDNGVYTADTDDVFVEGREYYARKLTEEDLEEYKSVTLNPYEANKYYYAAGDNYLLDSSEIIRNVKYFNKDESKIISEDNIKYDFIKDNYYEKDENGNYIEVTTDVPEKDFYYPIPEVETPAATLGLSDVKLYDPSTQKYNGKDLTYFWVPGTFAIKEADGDYRLLETSEKYDPNEQYYLGDWVAEKDNYTSGVSEFHAKFLKDEKDNWKVYKVNIINLEEQAKKGIYYYKLEPIENSNKYRYILATPENVFEDYKDLGQYRLDNTKNDVGEGIYPQGYKPGDYAKSTYYTLKELPAIPKDAFYIPDTFYFKEENNYIKDKSTKITQGRQYYTMLEGAFSPVVNEFYKANTYYYQVDGNYVLDGSFTQRPGIQYYVKNFIYVVEDKKGIYNLGFQWNRGVQTIPCTITLAKREEIYTMKVLPGFARTFNTIHGLIVNINKILLSGDPETRDRNTVQGCINIMNDIISRFDDFTPAQFLISDNYGRVASTPFDGDQWINIAIDGNPEDSFISITHKQYPIPEEPAKEVDPNKEEELITYKVILPRGRMHGDVDYDGIIDKKDLLYLERYLAGWEDYKNPDDETIASMDLTGDGAPGMMDAACLMYYLQGFDGYKDLVAVYGDILNNWSINPNHTKEQGKFYKDIDISGILTTDILFISGYENIVKFNIEGNNKIRIFVSLLPKENTEIIITKLPSHFISETHTEYDSAGHIIKQIETNYHNINNYGIFSDGKNNVIAENEKDVFTFKGDSDINVNINEEGKTLNISHNTPSNIYTSFTGEEKDKTLKFGDSFNVLRIEKNLTGHINNIETKAITLPQGSLKNISSGAKSTVLTSIGFTPETGEITYTEQNSEDLIISLPLLGDINGDGIVDEIDIEMILNHISKEEEITDQTILLKMDVNGDGNIDMNDVAIIKKLEGTTEKENISISNALINIEEDLIKVSSKIINDIDNITGDIDKIENDINNITGDINNIENDIDNITGDISQIQNLIGITDDETTPVSVKDQIDNALNLYYNKNDIDNILKNYYTKDNIDNVNYATESWVQEQIVLALQVDENTVI